MKPAELFFNAGVMLAFFLLSALSFADEPLATYNGTISTVTNTETITAGPSTGSIPPSYSSSGNFTRNVTDNRTLTFTILQPPEAAAVQKVTDFYPQPASAEVIQRQTMEIAKTITDTPAIQEALAEVLGIPITPDLIAEIAKASAEVLNQITTPARTLDIGASTSTLSLSFEYRGKDTVQNFVVYDTVPKSFARSAKNITVSAPGAVVRIVRDDPVYTFTYPELSSGQKVDIKYAVNARVNRSVLNDTVAPVLLAEKIKAAAVTPPPEGEKPKPPEVKPPAAPEKPPAAPEKPLEKIAKAPATKLVIIVLLLLAIIGFVALRRKPQIPKPPHRSAPPGSMPLKPPQKKHGKGKARKAGEVAMLEEGAGGIFRADSLQVK